MNNINISKANPAKGLALIDSYCNTPLQELKLIKPSWAIGYFTENLLNPHLHPKFNEYTIFYANTFEIIEKSDFGDFVLSSLFTGENLNDYRVASILDRWKNGSVVDPPIVGLNRLDMNRLSFEDGRHRTKVAWLLGHDKIPVAIYNSEIKAVSGIINLTNMI